MKVGSRAAFVAVMIFGSFVVYCTEQGIRSATSGALGNGGFVGSAHAGACCGTVPTFTKIAEGEVSSAHPPQPIDVHAYSELVLYLTDNGGSQACTVEPQFSADGTAPFGYTGQSLTNTHGGGGRIRVDGAQMKLVLNGCGLHYVLAGAGN